MLARTAFVVLALLVAVADLLTARVDQEPGYPSATYSLSRKSGLNAIREGVDHGQDCLPTRLGTAAGVTLGLAVSAGGLFIPLLGIVADHHGPYGTFVAITLIPLVADRHLDGAAGAVIAQRAGNPTEY